MIICFAAFPRVIDAALITYSSVVQQQNIISMTFWNVKESNKFLCVLKVENEVDSEKNLTRELMIYKEKGQELIQLFNYQTPDSPISVYSLGEYGARLFTAWTGGSSYHFIVFAYVDNKIIKVLDVSSKLMPEFAWDNNGNEIILITHLSWRADSKTGSQIQVPVSTEIYKWSAGRYEMIKKVPWQNRFETLQGIAY